jgi:hypothetical protein
MAAGHRRARVAAARRRPPLSLPGRSPSGRAPADTLPFSVAGPRSRGDKPPAPPARAALLCGVSGVAPAGGLTALMGPSGSGKSTLLGAWRRTGAGSGRRSGRRSGRSGRLRAGPRGRWRGGMRARRREALPPQSSGCGLARSHARVASHPSPRPCAARRRLALCPPPSTPQTRSAAASWRRASAGRCTLGAGPRASASRGGSWVTASRCGDPFPRAGPGPSPAGPGTPQAQGCHGPGARRAATQLGPKRAPRTPRPAPP